jgi:GNAT superfamily N-acetyltransferase
MSIHIRKAERGDFPVLLELITALAQYEKLDPPDEAAQGRLLEHGWGSSAPRFEAWLAERDGQAIGYAILFETYSSFLAKPTLYLEDLFVLPEHRRGGVGAAFFQRLTEVALQRGCGRMEWQCLDWNEQGLGFYARMGARRMADWVSFRFTEEDLRRVAES